LNNNLSPSKRRSKRRRSTYRVCMDGDGRQADLVDRARAFAGDGHFFHQVESAVVCAVDDAAEDSVFGVEGGLLGVGDEELGGWGGGGSGGRKENDPRKEEESRKGGEEGEADR
jgi:hypothetical protein